MLSVDESACLAHCAKSLSQRVALLSQTPQQAKAGLVAKVANVAARDTEI